MFSIKTQWYLRQLKGSPSAMLKAITRLGNLGAQEAVVPFRTYA
jgi:hypothetical protein